MIFISRIVSEESLFCIYTFNKTPVFVFRSYNSNNKYDIANQLRILGSHNVISRLVERVGGKTKLRKQYETLPN